MKSTVKKKFYKKIALAISLCAIIAWAILGTGASLAWFSTTTPEVNNIINMAEFKADVLFKDKTDNYVPIDERTDIFNDKALYEPGYTQTVYFKIINNGDKIFKYHTAVIIDDFISGRNVLGEELKLQDYLKFGFVSCDNETELKEKLETREKAQAIATLPLNRYDTYDTLSAGGTRFFAMVIYMPQKVSNVANYRGLPVPEVKLGVSVTATQIEN